MGDESETVRNLNWIRYAANLGSAIKDQNIRNLNSFQKFIWYFFCHKILFWIAGGMKVASLIVSLALAQDSKLLKRPLNVDDGIIMLVKFLAYVGRWKLLVSNRHQHLRLVTNICRLQHPWVMDHDQYQCSETSVSTLRERFW